MCFPSVFYKMLISFFILFNTPIFCCSDLLCSNNTFLLVKVCFTKPAITVQSSRKAETVGRFGKENVCE